MTPIDPDLFTRYGFHPTAHVDERTRAALTAYVAFRDEPIMEPPPDPSQVRLIAEYCQDFICLAFFTYPADELRRLRREVEQIRTVRELADWLWDCRRIGIEPL